MQFRYMLFFSFSFLVSIAHSQVDLLPSIGIGDMPGDATPVCDIPLYLGNFDSSGLEAGEQAYDFNLYDLNGIEFHLESVLLSGKAVLLVNGSYTCPVFRGKVPLINELSQTYGDWVEVAIVYTVEAHPSGDISPYFGVENVGAANIQEGILVPQPTTYGQRKSVVSDMLDNMVIDVPVFLDGPCNEWWATYGPAPNNAYLIDTDGSIYAKHPWFNAFPHDIVCDLDQLLDLPNNCTQSNDGSFNFELTGDSLVEGVAGSVLYVYGMLENNSDAGVEIEVKRLQENLPPGWQSSMCIDICLPTDVDETTVYLDPGAQQPYTMYFYTNQNPSSGMVRMGFRNAQNHQNRFIQQMYANTTLTTAVEEEVPASISIFPNPASGRTTIASTDIRSGNITELTLYHTNGRIQKQIKWSGNALELDLSDLAAGIYFAEITDGKEVLGWRRLVVGQ